MNQGMRTQTAESVAMGHPDKVCDQLADTLLDAYLAQDPHAHVAVECLLSDQMLVVAGEVKTAARIAIEEIVRRKLLAIGYQSRACGLDAETCTILINVHQQSPDIDRGVQQDQTRIGAGDQGTVYGYATNESPEYLPLALAYAHRLVKRLDDLRLQGQLEGFYPDGKAQVTVAQVDGQLCIPSVVLSAQHSDAWKESEVRQRLLADVIRTELPDAALSQTTFYINPTGRFVRGGPAADTGLTGRKLMVDTYGGEIPHGGGAFSGKDATKVDRSGAYMARYVAKNIVAAGLADRCLIGLSYAIGVVDPVSISVETFGTEKKPLALLRTVICNGFDYSVAGMMQTLNLARPQFASTAVYGHFKPGYGYSWEATGQAARLAQVIQQLT
ncbi:methionine adenosyltransferase [Lacticaseibacillus sp. GG6-2]